MSKFTRTEITATGEEMAVMLGGVPENRIEPFDQGEWRLEDGNLESGNWRFFKSAE